MWGNENEIEMKLDFRCIKDILNYSMLKVLLGSYTLICLLFEKWKTRYDRNCALFGTVIAKYTFDNDEEFYKLAVAQSYKLGLVIWNFNYVLICHIIIMFTLTSIFNLIPCHRLTTKWVELSDLLCCLCPPPPGVMSWTTHQHFIFQPTRCPVEDGKQKFSRWNLEEKKIYHCLMIALCKVKKPLFPNNRLST